MERVVGGGGEQGHGVGWANAKLGPYEALELGHAHPSRALKVTDSVLMRLLQWEDREQ